jgi:hypothetical protein
VFLQDSTSGYLWLFVSEDDVPDNLVHDYAAKETNTNLHEARRRRGFAEYESINWIVKRRNCFSVVGSFSRIPQIRIYNNRRVNTTYYIGVMGNPFVVQGTRVAYHLSAYFVPNF